MELVEFNLKRKLKKKIIKFTITVALPIFLIVLIFVATIQEIFNSTSSFFNSRNYSMLSLLEFKGGKLRKDIYDRYASMILNELTKQGVDNSYLPILLGQCQQESDGVPPDIFQASESKYGGRIGMIKSPEESTEQVVKRYKEITQQISDKGLKFSIDLLLQTYNFGSGYLDFVKNNGGVHSKDIALAFSKIEVKKDYFQKLFPGATSYGDPNYVEHVMRYVDVEYMINNLGISGNANIQDMLNTAFAYKNVPYKLTGTSFDGIDCSGLIMVVLRKYGFNLPHSSENQFYILAKKYPVNYSLITAKPGDIIFFKDTYVSGISHVGFYIGNNKMFDASGKFVDFRTLGSYWQKHFFATITIFN